jgi:TPR repeat protein
MCLACLLVASAAAAARVQVTVLSDYEGGVRAHERGNLILAIALFEQGTRNGDPKSAFALGTYYHFGEGVAQDHAKARALLEQSARKGYAPADAFLGIVYRQGQGVDPDKKRAVTHFTAAAYACDEHAQQQLADMLYSGDGISVDKAGALAWVHIAARKNVSARNSIKRLENEMDLAIRQLALLRKAEIKRALKCFKSKVDVSMDRFARSPMPAIPDYVAIASVNAGFRVSREDAT